LEGPYRDLGGGFARLAGAEGLRRSPRRLRSVEDALFELLRNSRDAGARNIYVASTLRARRYRQLVVIDDGRGIPETHKHLIFEPGVTTRHLDPVPETVPDDMPHGAGLSLYHVKNATLSAEVLSASSPTAIKTVFDTQALPEKSLQSHSRPSKTNLPATIARFAAQSAPNSPRLYHASPARILAILIKHRIIHLSEDGGVGGAERLREVGSGLGLEVSLRTAQRVVAGSVSSVGEVGSMVNNGAPGGRLTDGRVRSRVARRTEAGGPILLVGAEELDEIRNVLERAARSSYLDLAGLDVEARPGEVVLKAQIYEPEEEYE
jgi:Histidine kinase-, DNA gyrase B-, and HSP90-like ATPase